MEFHYKCIDCAKYGKECQDMTGTEPAGGCFVPKMIPTVILDPDMKPLFYEGMFMFKSLFPDIMPSISLKIRCEDPEIDPNIVNRIKNAAYREYAVIMKERQNSQYGFHVCGSWDAKEGDEDAEV